MTAPLSLRPLLLAVVLIVPSLHVSNLIAQQKTPTPEQTPASTAQTIAVDARLVNLPVVVRDKKGALVQTLTKEDFTLQVDGKPQTVRYFDKDTNLPLTLGLLVDTSQSQRTVLDEERTASSTFLDQMLTNPKDQAFVLQFAREVELLQDLTTSRPLLQKALKEIDTPSPGSSDDDSSTRSRSRGGTVLYDALFLASDELMSKQHGRKALIILSDGVDRNSKENLVRSIEAAQRADTIIYAIYFKGEESHPQNNNPQRGRGGYPGGGYPGGGYPGGGYPGGRGGYPGGGNGPGNGGNYPSQSHVDGKKILERMTHETGGRLFEVKKNQDVAQIYNQIAEELRAQYRLGYTPTEDASSSGYHQIDLSLHQKGLVVQTRDGYYAGK
ncbi:VWA domain-containing protein [Granulicella sp. S190]|uniref:VWA domain-containing protein n=1 Tax=Granulicella sp. S190 TaxID=1747226 RepID=UPI00131A854B|nr:VWA domain-containing protein [Granulicella sp. S190]